MAVPHVPWHPPEHVTGLATQLALLENANPGDERHYFYCSCGIVGKLRRSKALAQADRFAHEQAAKVKR